MKKIIMITMIAIVAAGMIGCGAEEFESANINWKNELGGGAADEVDEIKWESISGNPNQTWSDPVADAATSDTKKVTLETGKGRCIKTATGVQEYEILINDSSSTYVLTDGSTETLRISDVTAK